MADAIRGRIAVGLMGCLSVVFIVFGCAKAKPNTFHNRAGSEPKQGQKCIDASCISDADLTDVGPSVITPLDAASDKCHVVEPEESYDDGGMDEESQGSVVIEGLITFENECLSGVEVCITRNFSDSSQCSLVKTDRYGRFVYRDDKEYSSSHHLYIRPRKGGFVFDPEYQDRYFDVEGNKTALEPLKFTAKRQGFPAHATGRWRVIEDKDITVCHPDTQLCLSNPEDINEKYSDIDNISQLIDMCRCLNDPDQTGNTFEFIDGCLFGGINCVSDLAYNDVSDFCRSYDLWTAGHGLYFSPVIYEGEFDQDTQRWKITKSLRVSMAVMRINNVSQSTMILERE